MIDTGSDVSLVSEGIINRLEKSNLVVATNAKLSGANGLPVEVLGEIAMGFQMEGGYFQSKFLVVENFSHGILLGKDFLSNKGAIVDFHRGEMKIGKLIIPFIDKSKVNITSATNLVLEPYETKIVPVITKRSEWTPEGDSIFVGGGFLDEGQRVFIPKCLTRHDGRIQVSNVTDRKFVIKEGQSMATGDIIREYAKATPSFYCNKVTCVEGEDIPSGIKRRLVTAKDLDIGDLAPREQEELVQIVNDSGVIRDKLGKVTTMNHEIDTNGAIPINTRQYRCPISKRELIRNEAQKMLVSGVVTPSNSPWNSPVVLVAKPSGEQRFAIDFRKLNAVTKKQAST